MKSIGLYKKMRQPDRIVPVVLAGIAFLLLYFILSSYYLMISKSQGQVLQKLKAISNTASMMIDGDMHEYISQNYLKENDLTYSSQDSVYLFIHEILQQVKETNNIESPIYTLIYDSVKNDYKFIATSAYEPYFRHTYANYPRELKENFGQGGVIDVYSSENGKWLSAFSPIRNADGRVVAILQVDEKFDSFIAEANDYLFTNIVVSLILFVPFTIFLYRFMKTSLDRQERSKYVLEERNEEIQVQNEMIKESNIKLEKANALIEEKNANLDEEVKARTRELVVANEELETFLYRSSHDVQGPIASLRGVSHLATLSDDGCGDEYFEMIEKSATQLHSHIKSINAVFEVKRKLITYSKVPLFDFFNHTIQRQAVDCGFPDLGYTLNVKHDISITCDEGLLKIITDELVKNSINFRRESDPKLKLEILQQDDDGIRLIFSDNGQGISDEVKEVIFEMFKRGNEQSEGSGLGLYAVKLAVSKLNGAIDLLPSNGEPGAAFQIILPSQ